MRNTHTVAKNVLNEAILKQASSEFGGRKSRRLLRSKIVNGDDFTISGSAFERAKQPVLDISALIGIYGNQRKYLNLAFLDSKLEIIVIFIFLDDGIG